jgi:hypothetical protein
MLFQTTAAHEELRAKIRSFAEEEIKPLAFLMDQNNEFPEEAVKKLGKLGWMGIPYPKEYGGAGLDALSYAIAVEELARVDGGTGVILSAHVSLGSWPIFAYGTEEQKKKYLVPLAKGEKIGAFGLTETNAGSDAGGTETTALDKGDYYLLNGGKIFITNAPKADTYVVFAVTTPDIGTRGISAFIVEKGWKGFEFGDHYDKMGIRSSSTAELIFNTRTDEKAYSDSDGNFMISAKNNDALRFVKQKYDRITYSVKPEDFKNSIKITLIKSVVEIEEVEIKSKLTGNLREDARRVESVKKVKLNKEIAKYIAEKSDPEIIKPRGGEFVQPVGQGFSVGKVSNQADKIDLAEDFLEILGEDYFTDLGLKKSEISGFIFHVMSSLDLKNAYKYGYLKESDIAQFRKQAEIKINDFRKLK